jgi:hypothetical protein
VNPFFSPDGQWVAFFRNTELVKASADGGAPVVIVQTTKRSPVDGRFLMLKPAAEGSPGPTYVSVILNWLEELKQRVP